MCNVHIHTTIHKYRPVIQSFPLLPPSSAPLLIGYSLLLTWKSPFWWSWCEYPSTLVPAWWSTAHPLLPTLPLPSQQLPQFMLHVFQRRHYNISYTVWYNKRIYSVNSDPVLTWISYLQVIATVSGSFMCRNRFITILKCGQQPIGCYVLSIPHVATRWQPIGIEYTVQHVARIDRNAKNQIFRMWLATNGNAKNQISAVGTKWTVCDEQPIGMLQ